VARLFRVIGSTTSKPASAAIGATILLLMGSPIISRGATIEEVARCRAIEINKERWDCFKALKAPKRNDTSPSQTEDFPSRNRRAFQRRKRWTLHQPLSAVRRNRRRMTPEPSGTILRPRKRRTFPSRNRRAFQRRKRWTLRQPLSAVRRNRRRMTP
jgi:hypothetical protein